MALAALAGTWPSAMSVTTTMDCCDFVCNCDAGLGHDFGCYDPDTDLDHDHDYATTALLRPRLGRGLRPRLRLGLTTFCWFLLSSPHEHSDAKNDKNHD